MILVNKNDLSGSFKEFETLQDILGELLKNTQSVNVSCSALSSDFIIANNYKEQDIILVFIKLNIIISYSPYEYLQYYVFNSIGEYNMFLNYPKINIVSDYTPPK